MLGLVFVMPLCMLALWRLSVAWTTRVSFYHVIWLAKEKTKAATSRKSFCRSGTQTLFFGGENLDSRKYVCVRRLRSDSLNGVLWNEVNSFMRSSSCPGQQGTQHRLPGTRYPAPVYKVPSRPKITRFGRSVDLASRDNIFSRKHFGCFNFHL